MDNEDDEAPTLLSQDLSNPDLQSCFPYADEEEGNVIAEESREEGKKAVDDGTRAENKGEEVGDVAAGTTEAAVVVSEEREVSDSVAEGQGMQDNEIVEEDKVALAIDEAENVIMNGNEGVEEGTEVDNVESGKAEEDEDDNADVAYDDDNAAEIGHTQGTDDVIRDEEEAPKEEQGEEQEEKELGVDEGDSDGVGDDMTQDTDTAALMEEDEEGEEEHDADDGDGMARDIEDEVEQGGEDEEGGGGGDGMEENNEVREEQSQSVSGGKRKRGAAKNSKTTGRVVASKKKMEEDVCFICFDGGDLVLCNRRGCPKAYHPSCVNRDEAFFRTKGKWNCGWHLCSNCEKNAYYLCYTCTFSLCKGCIKDAIIFCVRGNKGFCETCMRTVMLIEQNEQGNTGQVDFDDKNSWEYLFKDYYIDLKEKLSLTLDEVTQAKNPWKGSDMPASKDESPDELYDANNDRGSDSDNSYENVGSSRSKRRKGKKRAKSRSKGNSYAATMLGADGTSADDRSDWASKELLEFVMHMRNGDTSILSQFDVQALLLEYIKRNRLRDPRRKSQIICDARLQNLFGKPRVGHFEMLKLLESHFLLKEDSQGEDLQGSVVDTEVTHLEGDGNSDSYLKPGKDKRRKSRKKGDERGLHSNVDDYAAIDNHNINLIYLRRNLVEDLLEDTENFHDKAVGSFARIRISGSGQKQDLYRLVQVAGTCKAAEPYKVGKKMTDILLEILNLNKTEIVSIDIISNQEFTEDECKRLRQSIKCGLINRLTVGNIQDKALALQAVRVKDWLETEIVRLSHLRDRASEKGRRKELRECVEKLQLLKTPEERQRRLEEVPEIHVDPKMDPSYESEEDEDEMNDKRQESYMRPRGSAAFGRNRREIVSPRSGSSDSWSGTRNYSYANRELSRNLSNKGFSIKGDDVFNSNEALNDAQSLQGRDRESQLSHSRERQRLSSSSEIGTKNTQPLVTSESFSTAVLEPSAAPSSAGISSPTVKINESEKMWHYQDPSGKVQGPFSIVKLRTWNNTGYFPADLRIWSTSEKQDESILLKDALDGKFSKESPAVDKTLPKAQMVHDLHNSSSYPGKSHLAAQQGIIEGQVGGGPTFDQNSGSWNSSHSSLGYLCQTTGGSRPSPLAVEVPKSPSNGWGSNDGVRNESANLPSPTPHTPSVGTTMVQGFENKWSPTPDLGNPNLSGPRGLQIQNVENGLSSQPVMMSASTTQVHPQATMVAPGLQNQVVSSHNSHAGAQGWGSGLVPKVETQALGATPSQRIEPNNPATMPVQNSASFITGNPTGGFPAQSYPGQSNISAPAPPNNMPWNMGVVQNQNAAAWGGMPGNHNTGWGGGALPANVNMNWMPAQVPAPVNANPGWAAAPSQGPPPVNAAGWVASGQGRPHVNSNMGWGQGHTPGNANPGWPALPGNQGTRGGGEQSHNGERLANQRDLGTHGGRDSGYGGKPWSRQLSFNSVGSRGGGSSRPPFGGQRVACKFNESGRCKKGASCDFMHT